MRDILVLFLISVILCLLMYNPTKGKVNFNECFGDSDKSKTYYCTCKVTEIDKNPEGLTYKVGGKK